MTDAGLELYVASACYGGQAHARHFRAILDLRAAAMAMGIRLRLDFGGGEALLDRGRAGALASFLRSEASHLLLIDGQSAFDPQSVLASVRSSQDLMSVPNGLLIRRELAERVTRAHSDGKARLGDIRGGGGLEISPVFASRIDPVTRRYATDLEPFQQRLSELDS